MNGRTFVLILFFWALLTVVTPTLIRMSASAKPYLDLDGEKARGMKSRLLPRRALVAMAPPEAPTPAPTPAALEPEFRFEMQRRHREEDDIELPHNHVDIRESGL